MPFTRLSGWLTSSPTLPSPLILCTETPAGKLYATSTYSPAISTLVWIGRYLNLIMSPWGESSPDGASRKAVRLCSLPLNPGPPVLDDTYRYFRDGCGHAYWMPPGIL